MEHGVANIDRGDSHLSKELEGAMARRERRRRKRKRRKRKSKRYIANFAL